jgi:hypothetical protein
MECRHLNGNRADARLSNLCWGTYAENGQDRVKHGTQVRGSRQHLAKVTEDDVREIRKLRLAGMTAAAIARRYNLTDVAVFYMCSRKTWSHVD